MILYSSDTDFSHKSAKISLGYLLSALFCALFGAVYELFSHEVYSYSMIYAFLFPLAGGTLPCSYTSITSPFGYRTAPTTGASTYHQGVDLDTGTGWPVYATRAGIAYTAYGSAAGNYVTIDHQDGFKSIYMHLSGFSVSNGTIVSAGQQIGLTGSTGVSTGDHLHFGISYNGV